MNDRRRYRVKSGTVTLRSKGRVSTRHVPGDEFVMDSAEVRGFKDLLEDLGPEKPGKAPAPKADTPEPQASDVEEVGEPASNMDTGFSLQQTGPGWYDVINNATGEKVNDKKLREHEAKALAGEA